MKYWRYKKTLTSRVQLTEFQSLIQFFADAIQKSVSSVNAGVWPAGKMSLQLQFMGCWFQIQNGRAFHDVHTHGNCSCQVFTMYSSMN